MIKTLREKEICDKCGKVILKEERVYICDNQTCEKVIPAKEYYKYDTLVHFFDNNNDFKFNFCSLECWIEGLRKISTFNDKKEHAVYLPTFVQIQDIKELLKKINNK